MSEVVTRTIVHEEGEKVIYPIDEILNDLPQMTAFFNAIEFSHNKIQLASQPKAEKDVFDIINEVMQLQQSLSRQEKETPIDWGSLTNLVIQVLRALSSAISSNPQAVAQAAEKLREVLNILTGKK